EKIAKSLRFFPLSWITSDGIDVTNDFIRYAMPLIGESWPEIKLEKGLQRFTKFSIKFINKKLSNYIPIRFRN
ncbi:unnamed protein product, partial [marine sediment metagenome]